MQAVSNAQVIRLLEQIGNHYRANIASPFIRPALMQLPLDPQDLVQVEMFTQKQGQYLGFDLEELYRQIAASARFVSMVRHDLLPVLRNRLGGGATEQQKVFRDMAVNNFGSNLKVFADLINELYVVLVDLDKQESKGRRLPLYMQMPELVDIGRTLVG
ncbi:MAG: hypothetical protein LBT39_01425 [Treponema sp.]|nr:hypothetical protein [Treponema sp.]